ncbi:MAG: hypothetical protein MJE77_15515 [Proteobacteria bacterium]|nr:hypothetical protein [Pseudomonadota bacterium]
MKSTSWLRKELSIFAVSTTLIAAVVFYGCAKDAESREADSVGQPVALAASSNVQATAVAIEAEANKLGTAQMVQPNGQANRVAASGNVVGGDQSYTLTLDAPESLTKGSAGVVQFNVVPKKGWKMNKEFPTKLQVTPPDGVTVAKVKQTIKDAVRFEDKGATFAVNFTADSVGKKSFSAKFKFAVCTDATCDPKKHELTWVVDVK